jgi:tetratricopeptide (TPR) repeat protein
VRAPLPLLLAVVLTAAGVGVGCQRSRQAGKARPAPGPPASAPASVPAASRPAELRTATKQQRRAYRKGLFRGRALAGERRWGEAVTAFEAALVAIPGDPRALSELSWAAVQAGDYAKARGAAADSVRLARDPRVRAASLYNAGRAAEGLGDRTAALRAYALSLATRQSGVVAERLQALGRQRGDAPRPDEPPCREPHVLDELCLCLRKATAEMAAGADPAFRPACQTEKVAAPTDVKVLRVDVSSNEANYYVALQGAGGWSVVGDLGYLYRGGIAGVLNEMEVRKVEERKVGPARVLWIETEESHRDLDLAIDEVDHGSSRTVTLCAVAAPGRTAPLCQRGIAITSSRTRERLGEMKDDEIDEDARRLMTPGLPVTNARELAVKIADDGTVSVTLVKGVADEETKKLLGPRRLW